MPDSLYPSRQRRLWRIASCVALLLSAVSILVSVSLFTQVQANRRDTIEVACGSANETTDRIVGAIKTFLVASTAAAGDTPIPPHEPNPFKWTDIRRGPLSKSIMRAIPNYPSGRVALAQARVRAAVFDRSIPRRDCGAEKRSIGH